MTFKSKHKAFVVEALACFVPPEEVLDALVKEYDLQEAQQSGDLSVEQLHYYDPTSSHGGKPGKRWITLFREKRQEWRENWEDNVAIANKTKRLEVLNEGVVKFMTMGNYLGAARLAEQAAKETGGKYTNEQKHEHSGPDGGPVQTVNANMDLSAFEETDDPEELMKLFNTTFGA